MSPVTQTRVAHIIHTTGIGGVETAVDLLARSARSLDFRVLALAPSTPAAVKAEKVGTGVNSLRSYVALLGDLRRFRPEVVVSSLWRSVIVGGLYRLRRPRTPWVIYVHNTRYTHPLDALVHRVAFRLADRILCDSTASREALVPANALSRTEVVRPDSVLLNLARTRAGSEPASAGGDRVSPLTAPNPHSRYCFDSRPRAAELSHGRRRLIYWGRAAEQKRLDRCLDLLAELERLAPGRFAFDIIAPGNDILDGHLAAAAERELPVTWLGACNAEQIAAAAESAEFFLQLSEFEGLAMSVREASALGLVPVVTPVGEISEYTSNGHDSVHVSTAEAAGRDGIASADLIRAADELIALDSDPDRLGRMRIAARSVVEGDFVSDFESAMATATSDVRGKAKR